MQALLPDALYLPRVTALQHSNSQMFKDLFVELQEYFLLVPHCPQRTDIGFGEGDASMRDRQRHGDSGRRQVAVSWGDSPFLLVGRLGVLLTLHDHRHCVLHGSLGLAVPLGDQFIQKGAVHVVALPCPQVLRAAGHHLDGLRARQPWRFLGELVGYRVDLFH